MVYLPLRTEKEKATQRGDGRKIRPKVTAYESPSVPTYKENADKKAKSLRFFWTTLLVLGLTEAGLWYFNIEEWVRLIAPLLWIGVLVQYNVLLIYEPRSTDTLEQGINDIKNLH